MDSDPLGTFHLYFPTETAALEAERSPAEEGLATFTPRPIGGEWLLHVPVSGNYNDLDALETQVTSIARRSAGRNELLEPPGR